MLVSTIRNWLDRKCVSPSQTRPRLPVRLCLEELEKRDCPAVFNIGAGDVPALIAAINVSNTNGQPDTINLAPGSTYTLTTVNNNNLGAGGLPVVALDGSTDNSLTINGNGAIVQRTPAGNAPNFRIFQVTGVLNLDSVTVQNGNSNDQNFGAGINVGSGGSLVLTNSAVINNVNQTAPGGGVGIEPGARNVTISNSTISGNLTNASDILGNGGGVETFNAGTLTIVQSTISRNDAGGFGGGLRAAGSSTVIILNSILADNVDSTGANDVSNTATILATNSIIPRSSGNAIVGSFSTADPLLGMLQNNGGLTPTHALLAGSPAIDAGNNGSSPGPTDQRGPGFNRIINGAVDIGAYEFQQTAVVVTVSSNMNPSNVGQAVTFTANVRGVAANSNVPQGSATFYVDGLPTATVPLNNGAASITLASLAAGSHSIIVVFVPMATGDYTFDSGVSNTLTQIVNGVPAPVFTAPVSRRWQR